MTTPLTTDARFQLNIPGQPKMQFLTTNTGSQVPAYKLPPTGAGGGRGFVIPTQPSAPVVSFPAAAAGAGRGIVNPAVVPGEFQSMVQWAGGGLQMPGTGNTGVGFQLPSVGVSSLGLQAPDSYRMYSSPLLEGGVSDAVTNMTTGPVSPWDSFKKEWIGTKDEPGIGGFALGALNAGSNLFFGMKQYGLAKQTLAENKRQFEMNYDAQRQTTNAALEDRQRARVASNSGAYQSVSDYMKENGVK